MSSLTEQYSGFRWIKVPRYQMDEAASWEERYQKLGAHHVQETTFLIEEVRKLAARVDELEKCKREQQA